jgi:cytoskeletal protein CcmA (bactofilin family)
MADASARVGTGTRVQGTIRGKGNLLLEGTVDGQVVLEDDVAIAPGGRVDGEVKARAVDVSGWIQGRVETGRLDVRGPAVLAAELLATTVAVEEGAVLQGYLRMELDLPPGIEG